MSHLCVDVFDDIIDCFLYPSVLLLRFKRLWIHVRGCVSNAGITENTRSLTGPIPP
jgi:hypothetical protein